MIKKVQFTLAILLFVNTVIYTNQVIVANDSNLENVLKPSIYTGFGDANLGGITGIGTEWIYKNFSVSLSLGSFTRNNEEISDIRSIIGSSVGVKFYNSKSEGSRNKIFLGINDVSIKFTGYYDSFTYTGISIICGFRHDFTDKIYGLTYIGLEPVTLNNLPSGCWGFNVGYSFNPIHL